MSLFDPLQTCHFGPSTDIRGKNKIPKPYCAAARHAYAQSDLRM